MPVGVRAQVPGPSPEAAGPRLDRAQRSTGTTPEESSQAAPRLDVTVPAGEACGESPWSLSANLGVYSQYVWRGTLVEDKPVLQGSATVAYKDLSLDVWGNVDLTDVQGTEWELNEVDLTLTYAKAFHIGCVPCEASLGAIAYVYPRTSAPTTLEIQAGLLVDVLLQPSLSIYREVLDQEYVYASFDLGHSFALRCGSLALAAGVGYGDDVWHDVMHGIPGSAFHEFHCRAAIDIPRGRWTLSPSCWWSSLLAQDARNAAAASDLFVAALIVSYTF